MRYLKDNDNRYRVNFMRTTEEMMDTMTVAQFISHLEENAEYTDDDFILSGVYPNVKIIDAKVYEYKEPNSNLRKEFLVTEDGRVFYWLSLIHKIELVDDKIPEGIVEGLEAGDTYRNFGCIWLVDSVYTTDNPDLFHKRRIRSHVIKAPEDYNGVRNIDCAYPERA